MTHLDGRYAVAQRFHVLGRLRTKTWILFQNQRAAQGPNRLQRFFMQGQGSAPTATELTDSPTQDFGVQKNGGNGGNGGKWGEMGGNGGKWGIVKTAVWKM